MGGVVGADTPTGLDPAEWRALREDDQRLLAGWHAKVAGDDEGRLWWPHAIRRLSIQQRLRLAGDPVVDAAWQIEERRLVAADVHYFVDSYGSVQPPAGPPVPFRLWPAQRGVLDALDDELILVVLKARQLGLTWIALHYATHMLGFNPETGNARILLLSKKQDDANKLLGRMRRINRLLPVYLRYTEDQQTGDPQPALSKIKVVGRGSVQALPASPQAPRMETVSYALLDEAAFFEHETFQPTWQALLPTLGVNGKACVISTGNGPPEQPGDGQGFARLWHQVREGDLAATGGRRMRGIFLPDSVHPERQTPEQRASIRAAYLSDEDYLMEHPETEDQALQGHIGNRVYPADGITAAVQLGRRFDLMLDQGTIPPPDGEVLRAAWDFGEHTVGLIVWPLEGGGLYVPREVIAGGVQGMSHSDAALAMCRALDDCQWLTTPEDGSPPERWPLAGVQLYDAAQPASNRTVLEAIERDPPLYPEQQFPDRTDLMAQTTALDVWAPVRLPSALRVRSRGMPFGAAVAGKGKSLKQVCVDYLRVLFRRSAAGHDTRIIAISPNCPTLIRQLRGLELVSDVDDRVKKGDDDAPDALLVGSLLTVNAHLGRPMDEADEVRREPARRTHAQARRDRRRVA